MNIIQWLLENNHAKAQRHAENIIALLELFKLYEAQDYEGIKARVLLYEAWKTSGLYDKKDRAACAMKAILGESVPAPVVDMFAEVDEIIGGTIEPDEFAESELSNDELDNEVPE